MDKSKSAEEYERSQGDKRAEKNTLPWSLLGGVTMAIVTLIGLIIGGQVYSHTTAVKLIEVMSPPLQMFAFATITATITMLALILTMLGVIKDGELGFSKEFYQLIERISRIDTILLIICAMLLTVLAIPVTESETQISETAATIVYYVLTLTNATIVGLLVAAVLMLFDAIKSVIRTLKVKEA